MLIPSVSVSQLPFTVFGADPFMKNISSALKSPTMTSTLLFSSTFKSSNPEN